MISSDLMLALPRVFAQVIFAVLKFALWSFQLSKGSCQIISKGVRTCCNLVQMILCFGRICLFIISRSYNGRCTSWTSAFSYLNFFFSFVRSCWGWAGSDRDRGRIRWIMLGLSGFLCWTSAFSYLNFFFSFVAI